MESNLTNTCISGGVYIVLYWRFTTLKPLKTSWAHPRQRWKKITRLVIVFGGHEALLQNYWMESWLEWAFVSPILELDYELPSRETGGNKHRPKIVLSNAVLFKYCLGLKRPEGDIGDCIQKITQLSLDFIQLCLSAVVSCGWLFTSLIFKLAIQPMDNYL